MLYRFGIKNVIKVNNLNLKYTTNLLVCFTWVQNLCNIKWLVIMRYDIQIRFSNEICWDHIIKILQCNFYLSHIFSFNRLALSHNNLWLTGSIPVKGQVQSLSNTSPVVRLHWTGQHLQPQGWVRREQQATRVSDWWRRGFQASSTSSFLTRW